MGTMGGPEGGGPDRCLGRPILGKASDVVLNGTIVAYKTPPGLRPGLCRIGVGGVVPSPREIGMGVFLRRDHRPTFAT